jgi:hypothetical protein
MTPQATRRRISEPRTMLPQEAFRSAVVVDSAQNGRDAESTGRIPATSTSFREKCLTHASVLGRSTKGSERAQLWSSIITLCASSVNCGEPQSFGPRQHAT